MRIRFSAAISVCRDWSNLTRPAFVATWEKVAGPDSFLGLAQVVSGGRQHCLGGFPFLAGDQQPVIELVHREDDLVSGLLQFRLGDAAVGPGDVDGCADLEELGQRLAQRRFADQNWSEP